MKITELVPRLTRDPSWQPVGWHLAHANERYGQGSSPRAYSSRSRKRILGLVYVGFAANVNFAGSATPATDGYPLPPGEELPVAIDRLDKVWIIASIAGHAVNFLAQ